MQLDRCRNSIGSRRTSNTQGRLSGQSVIVQFNMVWYLLVFILLSHVDSTTDHNQFCGGIPFVNLSPLNSDLNSNFRPDYKEDRVVYALFPESRAPECAAFPFSPLVACSTRDSDQTSSDIPSLTLSIGNSVTRDTLQTDHIENPAVQVLSPQSQALETVSFPLFSGNFLLSNQPDWQGTTNPILPGVASPTGNKDRIFREISAIDVSTGNSVQCVILGPSNTEERAVQVLSPQSLAPGSDSFQFFQAGQLQQNHQECPSTANPPSQFLGCSTGNSDHSPKCIPVFQLSPAKKFYDTCRPDNIADLAVQFQVPGSQAPGTATFPLSTDGMPSIGQISISQMLQTGDGSTPISDHSLSASPNVNCFSFNNIGGDEPLIGEIRSPLKFPLNWPSPSFLRRFIGINPKIAEEPLANLEVFVNSRRGKQTQDTNRDAVRDAVVIAVDNFLHEPNACLPDNLKVQLDQTREIAEYIVYHNDGDLTSCFEYLLLTQHQQHLMVRSALSKFKVQLSPLVLQTLATMSIVFRSTYPFHYHHPTLKLFWNASVILLKLHGASGKDYINCLKHHILTKIANRIKSRPLSDWRRKLCFEKSLNVHLSQVLINIANQISTAGDLDVRNGHLLKFDRNEFDDRNQKFINFDCNQSDRTRAAQVQLVECQSPGIDGLPSSSGIGNRSNYPECRSMTGPSSQSVAHFIGNSVEPSSCNNNVNLCPDNSELPYTVRPENIGDRSDSTLISEHRAPDTGSFPLSTDGIHSSQALRQLTSNPQSQTGDTFNENRNVSYLSDKKQGCEQNWPRSAKRKVDKLLIMQSLIPLRSRKRQRWPQPQFQISGIFCGMETPLLDFEGFFNSRRNKQTPNLEWDTVRNSVVIAIGNYLQKNNNCLAPETRQIAEYIVDHCDEDITWCFRWAPRPRRAQKKHLRSTPEDFKLAFSQFGQETLATMSIVLRSTFTYGYHHPILRLFWNASVKLLELHGFNKKDYSNCLKVHILHRLAYTAGTSRRKLDWNRNEYIGNSLNTHLSRVLSLITDPLETAGE
uniref:Uncharacterized protein n=1 Tax=Spongospora subterranea TaxID=70186 RepID=A0A0H5QY58_9EUKA|eukprot:CRZ06918.1 hypothetical protein [Spongospora subterranea]